jgi:hypothetical protein
MKKNSDINCRLTAKGNRNLPENEDIFFLDVMPCTPVKICRPCEGRDTEPSVHLYKNTTRRHKTVRFNGHMRQKIKSQKVPGSLRTVGREQHSDVNHITRPKEADWIVKILADLSAVHNTTDISRHHRCQKGAVIPLGQNTICVLLPAAL